MSRLFVEKYGDVPFVCHAKGEVDDMKQLKFKEAYHKNHGKRYGQKNVLAGL